MPGISQAYQAAFGKRQVQQRRRRRKGRPEPNLFRQQEGCDRPQLVQRQNCRKQPLELLPEPNVIERRPRNQITPQRYADAGRHQNRYDNRLRAQPGRNEPAIR